MVAVVRGDWDVASLPPSQFGEADLVKRLEYFVDECPGVERLTGLKDVLSEAALTLRSLMKYRK